MREPEPHFVRRSRERPQGHMMVLCAGHRPTGGYKWARPEFAVIQLPDEDPPAVRPHRESIARLNTLYGLT